MHTRLGYHRSRDNYILRLDPTEKPIHVSLNRQFQLGVTTTTKAAGGTWDVQNEGYYYVVSMETEEAPTTVWTTITDFVNECVARCPSLKPSLGETAYS